jgi:hypothetical protein
MEENCKQKRKIKIHSAVPVKLGEISFVDGVLRGRDHANCLACLYGNSYSGLLGRTEEEG